MKAADKAFATLNRVRAGIRADKRVGFVGSQPTLLLLHKIFRQASKSNNVGCDPTNPTYPFLFGY